MTLSATTTPEPVRSPRGAHLQMVGAVLAGDGLERIAEIASEHVRAPVAVIVPRVGASLDGWSRFERYVSSRMAGGRPERPAEVTAEVPIRSGGKELGAVLMLGRGSPDAGDYLHVAAVAALTEVAVVEAREETEQQLRGSFIEELLRREEADEEDLLRRARRLGSDLSAGAVALCAVPTNRTPGRLLAVIAAERPDALADTVGERVYAVLPGAFEDARKLAARLSAQGTVGISSRYSTARELRQAVAEAELVLEVRLVGGDPDPDALDGGTYRLLFRAFASDPEEVRSFYEDTVAPLVRYDEQYSTDLLHTLDAYLSNDCNMKDTAAAIHAHRHTVSYRLERIRELTGLDPARSEHRERLGVGIKAHRILAPALPR